MASMDAATVTVQFMSSETVALIRALLQEYPIVDGRCSRCEAELYVVGGDHAEGCELVRALEAVG